MAEQIKRPRASVVIPCFNEVEALPELRARLAAALGGIDGGYEVVIVDDGSTDDSVAYVERWVEEADNVLLINCLATSAWRSRCPRVSITRKASLSR